MKLVINDVLTNTDSHIGLCNKNSGILIVFIAVQGNILLLWTLVFVDSTQSRSVILQAWVGTYTEPLQTSVKKV